MADIARLGQKIDFSYETIGIAAEKTVVGIAEITPVRIRILIIFLGLGDKFFV